MRMTAYVWAPAVVVGLALLCPPGVAWAQASPSLGVDPHSPAVRDTIESIHRARRAERHRGGPAREMARVLTQTRRLLLDVMTAPAEGPGRGAAELLEANVEELRTHFEELSEGAGGGPGSRGKLGQMAARLDTLEARVAEVVAAPGTGSRRIAAASLLADLEANLPPQHRLINPADVLPTVSRLSPDHPYVRAVARRARREAEQ